MKEKNFYIKTCTINALLLQYCVFSMDDEKLKLISEVKEHPCLYNTKIPDYKISLKKENAWKAVAAGND